VDDIRHWIVKVGDPEPPCTEILPGEWIDYQPHRRRPKEFHDIELRDGTVIECCWPNADVWICMEWSRSKPKRSRFKDYRVVRIRRCTHPTGKTDTNKI
jgi:hypothetical protein